MTRAGAAILVIAACTGEPEPPRRVATEALPVAIGRAPRAPRPPRPASSSPVVQITAADTHACARHADGTVSCWGGDALGQLGDELAPRVSATQQAVRPAPIGVPIDGVLEVATGTDRTCARRADGVWCWGDPAGPPEHIAGTTDAVEITRDCARTAAGVVRCWGELQAVDEVPQFVGAIDLSSYGNRTCAVKRNAGIECRTAFSDYRSDQFASTAIPGAVEIAVGVDRTCVRTADGGVTCWSQSDYYMDTAGAKRVEIAGEALQVVAGDTFSCVRTAERVACWGNPSRTLPGGTVDAVRADEIAAGKDFVCARTGGEVRCWGDNSEGQLGMGWSLHHSAPIAVPGISDAIDVHVGATFSCARRRNGRVACWGELEGDVPTPVDVPDAAGAVQLTGTLGLCVRLPGGDVRCGERSPRRLWVVASDAADVSRTYNRSTIVRTNGTAVSWDDSVVTDGVTDVVAAVNGNHATCYLRRAGTVRCDGTPFGFAETRGSSFGGPLIGARPAVTGDGRTVPGVEHATGLAVGDDAACALLADASVRCWGTNQLGELGSAGPAVSPEAIPIYGLGEVAQISGSFGTKCARLRDGAVKCWGPNPTGILGPPIELAFSGDPIAMPLTDVVDISVGQHACAVLASGAVWCWGLSDHGQVGTLASGASTTPVPVAFPRPR